MRRLLPLLLLLAAALAPPALAQDADDVFPRAEDVATLDGIIRAYYEVVSGPAGAPRQWARDRSLHHPEAHITIIGPDGEGNPRANVMTLAEFHQSSGEVATVGFFEYEIHRVTERFGNTVHAWSTYEWKSEADGPVEGRGINSIQLYWAQGRWWITAWMFDNTGQDVPEQYLPQDEG